MSIPLRPEFDPWGWEDLLGKGTATHSNILSIGLHGQRSLVGRSPWGHKELDTTAWLMQTQSFSYLYNP